MAKPEGVLDALGRIVCCLGRLVRVVQFVPRDELIAPALEGATERAHFNRRGPVISVFRDGVPVTWNSFEAAWETARTRAGRPDVRLHVLRHKGLTYAAAAGATTAELIHRAGHASAAAVLRYQHAIRDRNRALADAPEVILLSWGSPRGGKRSVLSEVDVDQG